MVSKFKEDLLLNNFSKNTIKSYVCSVKLFMSRYKYFTKRNLLEYKNYLIENFKPKTVNLRITGINKYLEFIGKKELTLKEVRVQQKNNIENVISLADYEYFKKCLLKDKNYKWYFIIRFLAATGSRVSELIEFKIEHVKLGYIDIYGKGSKVRRIYIPKTLQEEYLDYISKIVSSGSSRAKLYDFGFIFKNKYGGKITTTGIGDRLKFYAKKYNLNANVVHPHSFRHLFAKTFLSRLNDISLLADLLGHDSIETTRICLRKSSTEQQQIVNEVVNW